MICVTWALISNRWRMSILSACHSKDGYWSDQTDDSYRLSAVPGHRRRFSKYLIWHSLDFLYQIADEMRKYCMNRKSVVFLPLIKTSQKFRDILESKGFRAAEVNGDSDDRAQVLSDFDAGRYNVLCNSMLLTEGWDCPTVDCIVVLRPTKITQPLLVRWLGRGRLSPGKADLLAYFDLWHTERHELCHPAHLICTNEEIAEKMTENIERPCGCRC